MTRNRLFVLSSLCLCASVVSPSSAADNWPQFRGLTAGVSDAKNLPDAWDTTKNVAWSADVPGRGWSSPVVWGNRVFLTTVTKDGAFDEAKKGLYFGGNRTSPPAEEHRWVVLCYDLESGKLLWQREAAKGKPPTPLHIKNTYASETPVTDGQRLYAYFGNQGLFCYDFDGKLLWKKSWGVFPMRFGWGTAASPVLHDGRLFIVNDNDKDSFLVCLDAKTGEQLWRVERDEKSNWTTPFVWQNEKRTELVTAGSGAVRSYDLDGKPLWELRGMSVIAIPTPFAAHGLLYVGSGYVMDKHKPFYAVRPGAGGDITLKDGQTSNEFVAWSDKQIAPYNPTPLVYGDYLYVLYDRGFLSCFEAKTGKLVYDRQRVPGQYTASPWAYDGKVFCLNEDGDTIVVRAGPKFEQVGRNKLDDMGMATPAIASDRLLIRTMTKLYCLRR